MPRVEITTELAETIKSYRIQNKIQSKDLAEYVHKSPGFITRIENGNIKTIDIATLYSMLSFIIREDNESKIAEDIYHNLTIKYTQDEIKEQLWFTNFETVKCLIPIPSALIDDINKRLLSIGISRETLLFRINSNEALSKEEITNNSIANNLWYTHKNDNTGLKSIKINIKENEINDILDKVWKSSPYIFILAIAFTLLKIERYGNKTHIDADENLELMNSTTAYLNSYKFYSVSEKNRLLLGTKTKQEYLEILNTFDIKNSELIKGIISGIKYASNCNITDTNEKLESLYENMQWDLGFMLKIFSINYRGLGKISVTNKRELLAKIENMINEYEITSSDEQPIEYY